MHIYFTYLPTDLPTYRPTYLPTYLPTTGASRHKGIAIGQCKSRLDKALRYKELPPCIMPAVVCFFTGRLLLHLHNGLRQCTQQSLHRPARCLCRWHIASMVRWTATTSCRTSECNAVASCPSLHRDGHPMRDSTPPSFPLHIQ
ncbi:hypothetical protein PMIN05_010526 [Paraphaeosphaeria minitans]